MKRAKKPKLRQVIGTQEVNTGLSGIPCIYLEGFRVTLADTWRDGDKVRVIVELVERKGA